MFSDFISIYVSAQLKDIIKPYARQVAVKSIGRHEIKYLNRGPFCFLVLKWWVRRSAETKFTWRDMQLYHGVQAYQRPAKQSKIASQRQYRVKEGDGFQELREVIRAVTGEAPQTRRETLKKAAELLRQLSREHEGISRHEPLPPLEISSASPYEVDQGSYTTYEPLVIPNNDTWTNAIAPWTRNSSPMSDTSATSSLLEYQGHSQAEIHRVVDVGGDWNLVQPTPSQFRQTSFSAQWNDLSLIHSNIDQVPYYVERVGAN